MLAGRQMKLVDFIKIGQTKIVTLLCVFFLVACDQQKNNLGEGSKKSVLGACPAFVVNGKPPIVQGAQCGALTVKENPRDEGSRTIELNILRLPAINPTPQPDPLFIIAGGPGQSAVGIAEHIFYTFNEVRKNRDIVFIDQRGTGKSNPLNCSEFDDLHYRLSLLEQQQQIKTSAQACAEKFKASIPFYTTPYAVSDLDAVRQALGYTQINLWGVSYGTRVALEYMRRYPAATRTSILDGVAPVEMALPWYGGEDAQAALRQLSERCALEESCAKAYGNLLQNAQTVAQRLQAQPVEITVAHPRTQAPFTLLMSHQLFSSMVRMALYSRDLATLLPLAITNARDDNYTLLASLISMADEQSEFMNISHAMHYTVLCNEDFRQYQQRTDAAPDFLLTSMVDVMREICTVWPQADVDDDYFMPVKSAVPALVLSGHYDPVTPPRWAERAMQHLTQARHLVAPGGHHSITQEGCVAQLIAQFIQRADAQELETACVEKIQPLPPYFAVDDSTQPGVVTPLLQGGE